MFLVNAISWPCRLLQQCKRGWDEENVKHFSKVEFKIENFETDDNAEYEKPCFRILNAVTGTFKILSQSINTIALVVLGFDIHRMQKSATVNDPLMRTHAFSGLKIPTMHFATKASVTSAIYKYHRDQSPFMIDNGPDSIFAYIVDMLEGLEIDPEDIIFTCSEEKRKKFAPFLNEAFSDATIKNHRKVLHECVQEALKNWATDVKTDVTIQSRNVVCDAMSRYFLGNADENQTLSSAMQTFF